MDLTITKKKYMIFNITKNVTKDNRPFIRMVLTDEEGSGINAIMFDSNKLGFEAERNNVVEVTGALQSYNGTLQLKVSEMVLLENADTSMFLPKSDKNVDAMVEELKQVLNKNIKSWYYKKLYEEFLQDEDIFPLFTLSPAAKVVHHAYIHGLLEHTLSMVKLSVIVAEYYGGDINKELLMLGSLFHDAGKVIEIDKDNAFEYTDEGRLTGHLLIGISLIDKYVSRIEGFPKKARDLLAHLIASHHGLLEYGSPVTPKIKEGILLHYIDNIDAKLNTIEGLFVKEGIQEGSWSSYEKSMDRPFYKHGLMPE